MSKPQHKNYSTTVFIVEGKKIAYQVTSISGRFSKRTRFFTSPEAALAWCRLHQAGLVYTPAASAQN